MVLNYDTTIYPQNHHAEKYSIIQITYLYNIYIYTFICYCCYYNDFYDYIYKYISEEIQHRLDVGT